MKTEKIVNICIVTIWAIVFACPLLLQYYIYIAKGIVPDWYDLRRTYVLLLAFLVLFLIHQYLLIPLVYARKHYPVYGMAVVVMLTCFALFTRNAPHTPHHEMPMSGQASRPDNPEKHFNRPEHHKPMGPPLLSPPDLARLIIAFLMLGVNLGADAMVKSQKQRRRLMELEKTTLKEQSLAGDTLFIKADYRTVRFSLRQITHVESKGEYLQLHLDNGEKFMFLMSIKKLANILPPTDFLRIHRSYIVNMNKVQEISKMRIKMKDGLYLPVSDMYKEEVQKYIDERTINIQTNI